MSDPATLAHRIKAALAPTSVLDVHCTDSLLVQSLLDIGIDARGLTGSEHDVAAAGEELRGRLSVGSPVDKIDGSWELTVCMGALDRLSATDAELAIDNVAAASQQVLFSAGRRDELNDQTPASWAASFAERGFYRRTDVDFSSVSPAVMLFERTSVTLRDLVFRYETEIDALCALVQVQRRSLIPASSDEHPEEIRSLRRQLLTSKDHAIGSEAELGTLRAENLGLHHEIARMHKALADQGELARDIADVRASATWKIGRMVIGPISRLHSVLRQ